MTHSSEGISCNVGSELSEVVMGKMEAFERAMPGQYSTPVIKKTNHCL